MQESQVYLYVYLLGVHVNTALFVYIWEDPIWLPPSVKDVWLILGIETICCMRHFLRWGVVCCIGP